MSGYIQTNHCVELPKAAYTINEADSGKLLLLGTAAAGAYVITLPSKKNGLKYRLMMKENNATNAIQISGSNIYGSLINNNAGAVTYLPKNGANNVNFVAAARLGDYIDIVSDGTTWFVSGMSGVVGFT